jgi:HD-GYP domain-containing protein (c-di-GMP phosphodiesterase class II)
MPRGGRLTPGARTVDHEAMRSLVDLVHAGAAGAPTVYGKRSLIALSHAMEDRGIAAGGPAPLVFGGFQRARFFAHDRGRYQRIGARSALTVAVGGGLAGGADGRLSVVGVGPEDPFWHDWVLVVYGGGDSAAVLVARDHARDEIEDRPTRDRRCDAVWSYDPRLTHAAARWVGSYLDGHDPALARRWNDALDVLPSPAPGPDRALTALGGHLISAMQREIGREQRAGRRLEESYEATIAALASAAEARDPLTDEHLARVARRAVAVGRALGMDAASLEALRQGARLHDVGKIGISDAVLSKPGRLTEDEMAQMRRHSAIGASIVARVPALAAALPVVRHHHERWDGAGYPDGLAGDRIPLGARVVAVVDAYDAMTADRPYRTGMDPDEALHRIVADRGAQFCPTCVDAFLSVVMLEQMERPAPRPVAV